MSPLWESWLMGVIVGLCIGFIAGVKVGRMGYVRPEPPDPWEALRRSVERDR